MKSLIFLIFSAVVAFEDTSTFRGRCILPINLDLFDLTKISFPIVKKTNLGNTVVFNLCGTTSVECSQIESEDEQKEEDKETKSKGTVRASSYIKVGDKCHPLVKEGVIPSVSTHTHRIFYFFPDQEDSYSIKQLIFTCDPNGKKDEFSKFQVFEVKNEIYIYGESRIFCDQDSFGSISTTALKALSWVFFMAGNIILFTGLIRIDLTIGYLLLFGALMQYVVAVYLVDKNFLFSDYNNYCLALIGLVLPTVSYFSTIDLIFRLMGSFGLFGLILIIAFFASPFIPVNKAILGILLGLGALIGFVLGKKYNFKTAILCTVITGVFWVIIGSNAFVESPLILLLELGSSGELEIIWEQISLDYIRVLIIVVFEASISVLIQIIELRHTYEKENITRQSLLSK